MQVPTPSKGMAQVNGTELYYERRGSGPSVLFIAGATGDGGHFERVAEALADEFTTVIYDRRGNSRSPRPAGWRTTSTEEQADDAAALLRSLCLAPAAMFATSSGAVIGLHLLLRHRDLIHGAIIHEPALLAVLPEPQAPLREIRPSIERNMAADGPRGAVEAFVRSVAGDAVYEALPADLRERMLNNGDVLFQVEFGALESYRPSTTELASVTCPVAVLAGIGSPPFLIETSRWLAAALSVPLGILPGGHAPYFERPDEMAAVLRPLLKLMV
jgi:pimeloyl-ACP methyl ester carboxylesterase